MKRSMRQMAVSGLIISIIVIGLLPYGQSQSPSDNIVIDFETELGRTGEGGGTLTYELHGKAAGDLRRAVLAKYDGLGSTPGQIDSVELKKGTIESPGTSYMADLELALRTNSPYYTIVTNSFDPLHENQGEDITVDAVGFVEVAAAQISTDDYTSIYIYLYFDALDDPEDDTDHGGEGLLDALYDPFLDNEDASNEIDMDDYQVDYNYKADNEIPGFEVWIMLMAMMVAVGVVRVSKKKG